MTSLSFVNPATYLSPRVRHIICQPLFSLDTSASFFDGPVLSWPVIASIMKDTHPDAPVDSFEYYEKLSLELSACFHEAETKLSGIDPEEFEEIYGHLLKWTNLQDILKGCFGAIQTDTDGSGNLQSLLLSTATLERSLGNVYLMRGSQCPSMLKDLLLTSELGDIFGESAIQLLGLFMGPPVSLNLRNVVWHGFPIPGEIHKRFGYMMIIIAASLGSILENKGIAPESIPQRPFVAFPQVAYMCKVPFADGWAPLVDLAKESGCVPSSMISIWESAIHHYSRQRVGVAVSLMLPQMEHMVRRIFAAVNECPDQILTAENTVLFTTFDEMLNKTLPDGNENRIREFLGDNVMDLIFDLLAYPDGPRLRDRVSHGESNVDDLPREVVDQVFFVCAVLCIRCIASDSPLHEYTFVQKSLATVGSYESTFFPINVQKRQIRELITSLNCWKTIRRPTADENQERDNISLWMDPNPQPLEDREVYKAAIRMIEWCSPGERQLASYVAPFKDIQVGFESVLSRRITTIYRWKDNESLCPHNHSSQSHISGSESELVGYINRITTHAKDVSEQVHDVMECRYGQWQHKELRSRQRNTYNRMIESVPVLSSSLRLTVILMTILLMSLDGELVNSPAERIRIVKKLRMVLQYCENLKTYTSPAKNKWDEAVQITEELYKRLT